MIRSLLLALAGGLSVMLTAAAADTNSPALWPGARPDGSVLLPNQWSLRPAGQQVELGDFPVNIAVHPKGRYAAVLHSGYSQHEIVVVDLPQNRIASRTNVPESFYGLAFSKDGGRLFCSGASGEVVYGFDFGEGVLSNRQSIRLRGTQERGVPVGVTVAPSGKTLFAANLWNSRVSEVDLESNAVRDIVLGEEVGPVTRVTKEEKLPAQDFDTAAATKRAKAMLAPDDPNALFPYACALDAKHDRLYVSLWGAASVAVVDLKGTNASVQRWAAGQHPCEMALRKNGKVLFVANANDNTVSVLETKTGRALETLWATPFPNSPRGATPNSLALSPDGELLFVANANINAIAVFDVSTPGRSRSLGFIPSGWYPTCVRVTPNGRQLLIANGKGKISGANPEGPQPAPGKGSRKQYIASLFKGTLSIVDLPARGQLEQQLAQWTSQVLQCTPLRPDAGVTATRPEDNPIPSKPGEPSPITHCIYIVKENRTYDQVFGDMPQGNGDPKLCLFPERVTPNLHKLAREFVLLDNFYADAEVSADGHEWSMGAYATDFVEKTWPMNYGHGRSGKFPYPSEGAFPIAAPASGYIWDRAAEAGVSYRSYGEFLQNPTDPSKPMTARLKSLQGHFDPWYRGFDLGYADTNRAGHFIAELHRMENEGDMPRLQIVRLPNDHTHGLTAGQLTPTAFVADNDLALGMIVEAVSHSKFWTNTAIFVVEDDAQNGPDHVDAHRTEALVISPYTRLGATDSTLYSTSSMLRTMELILGLQPMTQFDAAAVPMFKSFQAQANAEPYAAAPAGVDLNARNSSTAWGANLRLNFAQEDAVDDFLLSELVWRSVKGEAEPMPAPVRAGFVVVRGGDDD